jgi:hypothetical protein
MVPVLMSLGCASYRPSTQAPKSAPAQKQEDVADKVTPRSPADTAHGVFAETVLFPVIMIVEGPYYLIKGLADAAKSGGSH